MKTITIHSDGGCHGNPGPGGWAAVLEYGATRKEIGGGVPATTNNRMELRAAVEALQALKEPCAIEFFTDSEYLRNGIASWINGWKANGWRTRERKPVKNDDLWRDLDAQAARHRVDWKWVKGHAGHAGNERCDARVQREIARIKKEFTPAQLQAQLDEFKRTQQPDAQQASLAGVNEETGGPGVQPR